MLYDAVNNMDLSLMPKLSLLERNLLLASDNKDLFVEKFGQMIEMRMAEDREGSVSETFDASRSPPKLHGISRAGTKAHLEGSSGYALPRDTHEFESKVLYKGIPIPVKVPTAVMPETVGDFSIIKLIQTFSEPHAKSPQPFPVHPHLTSNGPGTHPIIVLANALLTQKRIIFLGHNMPSGDVAEAVLAACALASGGVLRGFTRFAFPYTDLTKIDDLLNVPGFIAGVTNPTFELHPEWWDILCDIPSGRVKISSKIDPAPVTEGMAYFQQQHPAHANLVSGSTSSTDLTGDMVFMNDILKGIAARLGERVIRAKLRDWVVKFTRIAAAFEESVYGASALYIGGDEVEANNVGIGGHGYVWADDNAKQRELAGNVSRIEGWRNTRSYYSFIQVRARTALMASYFRRLTSETGPCPDLHNPAPQGSRSPPHARPSTHAEAQPCPESGDLPGLCQICIFLRRDMSPAHSRTRVARRALLPGLGSLSQGQGCPRQDGRAPGESQ